MRVDAWTTGMPDNEIDYDLELADQNYRTRVARVQMARQLPFCPMSVQSALDHMSEIKAQHEKDLAAIAQYYRFDPKTGEYL